MPSRLRKALAGLLAAATVCVVAPGLLPAGSAADALPACSRPGGFTRAGDWIAAKAPRFVERVGGAGQEVSTYAVDPGDPQRVFVTNGTSIAKSLDAGCTWTEVFSLPETPDDVTPFAASSTRLIELAIPEDDKYDEALFVLAQESTDAGGRPHVLYARSAKRGKFEVRDSGLPPAGRGHDLTVGVVNSDFLYLAVDSVNAQSDDLGVEGVAAPLGGLYASSDGAKSWTRRTPATEQRRYDRLAIDPGSSNALWAVEAGLLRHSGDGGRTFAAPAPSDDVQTAAGWAFTALTVVRPPRRGAVVHAYSRTSATGRPVQVVLDQDGAHVTAAAAPGPVETAASGYDGVTAMVSTRAVDGRPARVHVRVPGGTWTDITPTRTTRDLQVSTDRSGRPQVRAVSSRAVLTYAKQVVPPPPPLPPPAAAVADPGLPRPVGPPSITPARTSLTLEADESRRVPYTVRLPHRPVPLDLYFVVDSSESMTEEIPVVRRDALALVADLRRAGVDVWAGLGYYKTDCRAPAYRRELAVGPTDDPARLGRALDALDTSDAPGLETQLFALDQAVTGSGAPVVPPPPKECGVPTGLPSSSVPAGQEAGFRDAALKVVVHIADITFRRPWCDPDPTLGCTPPRLTPTRSDGSPDLRPAAAAYAERGVRAIGIAADRDGLPDLREFAALTGTRAPEGGADCDGDGAADLAAGEAFVCSSSAHLADPLQRLLAAVSVQRTLRVSAAQATGVLTTVTPAIRAPVDVTRDLVAPVSATFSCKGRDAGTHRASFTATLTGGPAPEPLGRVDAVVTCLPRPLLPLVAPAAALVPPLPPPVAPAPAPPVVDPAPGTQPQVQVQTQLQPQVQTGAQEQERTAAALAMALAQPEQEASLDIVPMSRRDAPVAAWFGALVLVTAGAGVVAVRRQQHAVATVKSHHA